jgi:hypothetical protein
VRSASLISQMQIGASSFEGFRAASEHRGLCASSGIIRTQPRVCKKIRRQTSAAEISCGYGANLLANDAGIVLRQREASLMLLF